MSARKTVFINGGSRGIGAEMVRLFSSKGYLVAFSYYHSEEKALALASELGAIPVRADSASEEDIAAAVSFVEQKLGDVDVLINNAAVSFVGLYTDMTDGEWERMLKVNLKAPEKYIRLLLPRMISRKSGKIIRSLKRKYEKKRGDGVCRQGHSGCRTLHQCFKSLFPNCNNHHNSGD